MGICWTKDDCRILTCDDCGAIYDWNILTGTRLFDCVTKENEYLSLTLTNFASSTFAITKSGYLLELLEGNIVHQVQCNSCCNETTLTNMALSAICATNHNSVLLIGSCNGCICEFKFPLENDQTAGNQFQVKRLVPGISSRKVRCASHIHSLHVIYLKFIPPPHPKGLLSQCLSGMHVLIIKLGS